MRSLRQSILAMVFFLLPFSLIAQEAGMQKRTPEERAQHQTRWMQKNLGLNEDQASRVNNINLLYARQMDSLVGMGDKRTMRGNRKQLMQNKDAALQGVLTGDQFQKYSAHEQQMMEQRKERKQGGGMPVIGD